MKVATLLSYMVPEAASTLGIGTGWRPSRQSGISKALVRDGAFLSGALPASRAMPHGKCAAAELGGQAGCVSHMLIEGKHGLYTRYLERTGR